MLVLAALLAPLIAPHNPFDLRQLSLARRQPPPASRAGRRRQFLLGTDNQGRDILSTILYGSRLDRGRRAGVVWSRRLVGVMLGLVAGYFGGRSTRSIMRIADVS